MCTKNDPIPSPNSPIFTIAQIIKFVMSSAAEAELAGLFICAKEMVPLCQSLIEMGWPQPKSAIQTDNTTTLGVANKTIMAKKKYPWTCVYGGSDAANPKGNFDTSGAPDRATSLTTQPRPTQTYTMNPNVPSMLDNSFFFHHSHTHFTHCKGVLRSYL
eukprot:CCRYP_020906-RB/>CCRYP_020906-RB protein AED:0.42 eAED:0.41 QI:0/-1/0/1/-1/1/1/0/158